MASLLAGMALAWSKTLRYRQIGYERARPVREAEPIVITIWHDELFAPCYFHRNEGIIAVVSASRDGEYLAGFLSGLGYNLARGSSTRGGAQALRSALRKMRGLGRDVVFTVDGPKGPRHRVKDGALYLAAMANAPVMPVRVRVRGKIRFRKAWDRFLLPLPGARCELFYGIPYRVGDGARMNESLLQSERQRLQDRLDGLVSSLSGRGAE
jgi:hypothetical protein